MPNLPQLLKPPTILAAACALWLAPAPAHAQAASVQERQSPPENSSSGGYRKNWKLYGGHGGQGRQPSATAGSLTNKGNSNGNAQAAQATASGPKPNASNAPAKAPMRRSSYTTSKPIQLPLPNVSQNRGNQSRQSTNGNNGEDAVAHQRRPRSVHVATYGGYAVTTSGAGSHGNKTDGSAKPDQKSKSLGF
jgi:hypothetical protein